MMLRNIARSVRSCERRFAFQRFNSTATKSAPKKEAPFDNKYNFNVSPPPIHEYWNNWNNTVLLAFIPVFLSVTYLAKLTGNGVGGFEGLLTFAEGESSPLTKQKFGEAQTK